MGTPPYGASPPRFRPNCVGAVSAPLGFAEHRDVTRQVGTTFANVPRRGDILARTKRSEVKVKNVAGAS